MDARYYSECNSIVTNNFKGCRKGGKKAQLKLRIMVLVTVVMALVTMVMAFFLVAFVFCGLSVRMLMMTV